ncbi:PP2C-like domain-containing protein CG9801 isoform X2 [Aphidius gifuensis]|uniref:PP2C-like domain-containing protein CG9801 isoform X2 n=1 Tax=Aphidius gifuensis TaxID=684658 RepID=UPI001CDD8F0E|nr:PP2C-like domain-containing protein CG9801 isoform X2 [Aphidius gifuensis]
MPSLRKKVVGFMRHLSIRNLTATDGIDQDGVTQSGSNSPPAEIPGGCFVTKYLNGLESKCEGPIILHGRNPEELPSKVIDKLDENEEIFAALTGPDRGLTSVNLKQKHLSISDPDVDYIDILEKNEQQTTDDKIHELLSSESTNDNDHSDDDKIELIMSKISDDLLDIDDTEMDFDIIPPPSDFATDMIPLRKSKSAPAPFKKNQQDCPMIDEIAGIENWFIPNDAAYGVATTLYEKNPTNNTNNGEPIADCFALVARPNAAVLVLADGVNWGAKACIAARSAVHGCMEYLNKALFSSQVNSQMTTTRDVFIALLRSFHAAHSLILQEQGMLTTLTVCAILPLPNYNSNSNNCKKYIACTCNVGDSLAYVYSKKTGVREITRGSHDIHCMRDMRDALGALGPVDGSNPELNNLTLAMTEVEKDDIVYLTSDGISDNFDPIVGKFAILPNKKKNNNDTRQNNKNTSAYRKTDNLRKTNSAGFNDTNELPVVEAYQRHELTLIRMEDLLNRGVSGEGPPCKSAKKLCELLLDFAVRITAAKRRILEDTDLYYSQAKDGELIQLTKLEQRSRRKKMLDIMSMVPGKLDHATVVAYVVGSHGIIESDF